MKLMNHFRQYLLCLMAVLAVAAGCAPETTTPPALTTTAAPAGGDFPAFSPPTVLLRSTKKATIYYSVNGKAPQPGLGNTSSGESPVTVGPFPKDTTLKFYAVDDKGTQEVTRTETYHIIRPPVTTADPPGGLYGVKPLYITLEAKAVPPASPQYIYYTIDGTTPTVTSAGFDSPAYVTLLNEGPTLVRFFATDTVGNIETPVKSQLYTIDTVPPVTTASAAGCQPQTTGGQCPIQDLTSCAPFTGPTSVILSANEPATIYYSVDGNDPSPDNLASNGGNTFSGSTSVSVPINVSTTLKYFAVDLTGNAESVHTAFYKVGTGPISKACPQGGAYNVLPFTVTIVASPLTPTATIWYTLDGTVPTTASASTFSLPVPAVVTFTMDGIYPLTFLAYNGNWEGQTHQQTFVIDTIPPKTTAAPCGGTFTGSGQVSLSADEPSSTYYTKNGLPPSPGTGYTFSGTTPPPLAVTITQDTTLTFYSVDAAGNIETTVTSCSYQVVQEYDESFTTRQYENITMTTADWDTGLGMLLLNRLTPALVGQFTSLNPSQDVDASGGNAFLADMFGGLKVFDVSNPAQPNLLATYPSLFDPMRSVKVSGNYAYVGTSSGLVVLDVSNRSSPQLAGQIAVGNPFGTYVQDVAVSGDYALLADQGQGLIVVGLTVIGSPRILTAVDLLPSDARGVAVSGYYAFVADGANGLKIVNINVSDPTFATLSSAYTTAGVANAVAVSGRYAYVGLTNGSIQAVDISSPLFPVAAGNPIQISTFPITRIAVRGNYAYCSAGTGIEVVDISIPSTLTPVGGIQGIGAASSVAVSGQYAYMANGTPAAGGLVIIRIADPVNLSQVGQLVTTTSSGNSVAAYGNIGLLADGANGLRVIDITNPTAPSLLATVPTATTAARVSLLGGSGSSHYALVADSGNNRYFAIAISNPLAPASTTVNLTGPNVGVRDIAVFGQSTTASPPTVTASYALIAQGTQGVKALNMTNPLSPSVSSTIATTNAQRIALNGNTAYVADGTSLRVVNISDITTLSLAASLAATNAQDVALSGSYLYLADGAGGVKVYSVSSPASPTVIGAFTQATQAQGIAVAGHFAYVADGTNGLRVLDVTFPNNPFLVQTFTTTQARGVTAWGDFVLVADGSGGFRVIRAFKNLTDYLPSGTGQSIIVNGTRANIAWAQLSVTQYLTGTTTASYYLSNNGGITWNPVTAGTPYTFVSPGTSLMWKALLSTTDPTKSPQVDFLTIVYKFAP